MTAIGARTPKGGAPGDMYGNYAYMASSGKDLIEDEEAANLKTVMYILKSAKVRLVYFELSSLMLMLLPLSRLQC